MKCRTATQVLRVGLALLAFRPVSIWVGVLFKGISTSLLEWIKKSFGIQHTFWEAHKLHMSQIFLFTWDSQHYTSLSLVNQVSIYLWGMPY